ncbi:GrpB family protein [Streptomyces sp. BE230]|uniref:GrpB family protein n=1 Tax=Streptomyces sp. BE230 TaxID=3002526 RepID=UPI002ED697C8|nr:GrpB family protein [Streptomyces sp. BE230]
MPFPDEPTHVDVVGYRPQWPEEFKSLAAVLRGALGDHAVGIDHVGSTSVPGLPAKNCIDVQVRMRSVDKAQCVPLLSAIGFRCRPEPWNCCEVSAWGVFKQRLALSVPDLVDYGQIKAPATEVLMAAAEGWASRTGWGGATGT